MALPIYVYGSEVLRAKAKEVEINEDTKPEILSLLEKMDETMRDADGVGLAAPQVGKSLRILIVDGRDISDSYPELHDFVRTMINPEVLEESDETSEYSEGCLSIPDVNCNIVRPKKIKVRFINENFETQEEEFDGFASRMLQHELDHLEGILFTDRAAPIRKKIIGSKLFNISKGKIKASYKTKLEKGK